MNAVMITLSRNVSDEPRLTVEEAQTVAAFAFKIHDHEAKRPAEIIWWERVEAFDPGN